MLTRRQALAAGGGALGLAGPGVAAAAGGDRVVLSHAVRIERLLVWAYEHVMAAGTLGPGARDVVSLQLRHEREHLAAVEVALAMGPLAPLSSRRARELLARHHVADDPQHLTTQHRSLRFLVDLESAAEGVWFRTLSKLQAPRLARLGAEIMASEAQHWTLLSSLSHPGEPKVTVPNAFVRGT